MTPKIRMPVIRQMPRDPDRPLWRRLLRWFGPVVYELAEPYRYQFRSHTLCLPVGFRSDLASVPRICWLLGFRPDGMLTVPALFHDWYYRHGRVLAEKQVASGIQVLVVLGDDGKIWGDKLFWLMLREISGLRTPAFCAYLALLLFGWPAWLKNRKYRYHYEDTGKWQLQGDYRDDHDDPAEPAGK